MTNQSAKPRTLPEAVRVALLELAALCNRVYDTSVRYKRRDTLRDLQFIYNKLREAEERLPLAVKEKETTV